MSQKMNPDDVAIVIKARKILKESGFSMDTDIKALCKSAEISRKTGYQRAAKFFDKSNDKEQDYRKEFDKLQSEHETLKKRFDDVRFENEGRKIAWEIHGVDDYLARKKNTMGMGKKKKP